MKTHPSLEEIAPMMGISPPYSNGAGKIITLTDGTSAMLVKAICRVGDTETWDAHIAGDPVDKLRKISVVTK